MGGTYITLMGTLRTMICRTSSWFTSRNTSDSTCTNGICAENSKSVTKPESEQQRGTVLQKVENGIGNTRSKLPLTVVKKDYLSGGVVYNLTTSKTNTFVVNGVLVHNCDALQYACLHHDKGSIFGKNLSNAYQEPERVSMAAWT